KSQTDPRPYYWLLFARRKSAQRGQDRLEKRSRQSVLLSRLFATRATGIGIVALLAFFCFSVSAPRLLSIQNLIVIIREASFLCILAVGMTYLLIAGEFDLSVGSNYGFLVTVIAFLIVLRKVNP